MNYGIYQRFEASIAEPQWVAERAEAATRCVPRKRLLVETMFLRYKNKRRRKEKHLETTLQRKHM